MGEEGNSLLGELDRKKGYIAKSAAALLAFWLLEFAHQYFLVSNGNASDSLIRASSLGGALLVGLALAIGPLQALAPKYDFIKHRRTLAVGGFVLIIAHGLSVIDLRFGGNVAKVVANLNPLQNAIAFGVIAYALIFPLLLTSTDWAIRKLKYANWKALHRTIFFTWTLAVMHFLIIRPAMLQNAAGYALLLVTASVYALQFSAFVKRVSSSKSRIAIVSGAAAALFLLSLAYLTWPKAAKVFGF